MVPLSERPFDQQLSSHLDALVSLEEESDGKRKRWLQGLRYSLEMGDAAHES